MSIGNLHVERSAHVALRASTVIVAALALTAGVSARSAFGHVPQNTSQSQAATAVSASSPDLTGLWIFNQDASDKPPQRGQGSDTGGQGEHRPAAGGGGGGGFGGGRGRGGGGFGGGGGGGRSPEDMERARAVMEVAMRAPQRLTIVRTEADVILTDEEGRTTRLTPDGKKNETTISGQEVEMSAKWSGSALHVERKFKGEVKVVDEISLAPDQSLIPDP
jgi:hypothetical protein